MFYCPCPLYEASLIILRNPEKWLPLLSSVHDKRSCECSDAAGPRRYIHVLSIRSHAAAGTIGRLRALLHQEGLPGDQSLAQWRWHRQFAVPYTDKTSQQTH